jgi:hypothetical protein
MDKIPPPPSECPTNATAYPRMNRVIQPKSNAGSGLPPEIRHWPAKCGPSHQPRFLATPVNHLCLAATDFGPSIFEFKTSLEFSERMIRHQRLQGTLREPNQAGIRGLKEQQVEDSLFATLEEVGFGFRHFTESAVAVNVQCASSGEEYAAVGESAAFPRERRKVLRKESRLEEISRDLSFGVRVPGHVDHEVGARCIEVCPNITPEHGVSVEVEKLRPWTFPQGNHLGQPPAKAVLAEEIVANIGTAYHRNGANPVDRLQGKISVHNHGDRCVRYETSHAGEAAERQSIVTFVAGNYYSEVGRHEFQELIDAHVRLSLLSPIPSTRARPDAREARVRNCSRLGCPDFTHRA